VKVLLFGRYSRKGASTRLRFLQYLPYLRASGIEVTEVAPLLDDAYLAALYSGKGRSLRKMTGAYLGRLAQLVVARSYDLLWIEKELFPRWPAAFERLIVAFGKRYVVDYDDAVFHQYDRHPSKYVRLAMGGKIDAVMKRAALVVAGNEYLAARARAAGAPRVEVVPTVVDLDRYPTPVASTSGPTFKVGWVGTPMTASYLELVRGPLASLKALGADIVAVGAPPHPLPQIEVDVRPWTEHSEVSEIQRFDVGIMPLPDEPWERGKCGYKLIQYMACSKPVIASPVGANLSIVQHGVNGFLARTDSEWRSALEALSGDPQLRARMGAAGRRSVEQRYCLAVGAPRMRELLKSVGDASA
jgi:glycosyltransferase involved in cell wall biosynthesis